MSDGTRNPTYLKATGEYRRAGQFACMAGEDRHYGCHFGMRSSYSHAVTEYLRGWDEIHNAIVQAYAEKAGRE
jgi:hypothetical protein